MNTSDYRTRMTEAPALWITEDKEAASALEHDAVYLASGAVGVPSIADLIAMKKVVNIAMRDAAAANAIADSIRLLDAGKRINIPRPAAWRGVGLAERLNACTDKGAALADLMHGAGTVEASGIVRWKNIQRAPVKPGILTRIPELDMVTNGLHPGIYEFVACPGAGKSTLTMQIIGECIDQDVKCFYFSGEQPASEVMDWMTTQLAGEEFIDNYYVPETSYEYSEADNKVKAAIDEWIGDRLVLYDNETASPHVDRVLSIAENLIHTEGVKVVLLDNLMAIDAGDNIRDYNRAQGEIMKRIKAFQRATGAIVLLVCHSKKIGKDDLNLESVSGTYEIANWANYVFGLQLVENEEKDYVPTNMTTLKILKARTSGKGRNKKILMKFDPSARRFSTATSVPRKPGWEKVYEQMFGAPPVPKSANKSGLPF